MLSKEEFLLKIFREKFKLRMKISVRLCNQGYLV